MKLFACHIFRSIASINYSEGKDHPDVVVIYDSRDFCNWNLLVL